MNFKKLVVLLGLLSFGAHSFASMLLDGDLSTLVGYTIVANKTIVGWQQPDDGSGDSGQGDDFQGCRYNRVIVFDDNTELTCIEYDYNYSYRPIATILSNGTSFKMVVNDHVYDMMR